MRLDLTSTSRAPSETRLHPRTVRLRQVALAWCACGTSCRGGRGRLAVDDQSIVGPSPDRGIVFEQHTLLPWKSVRDNVAFGPKMRAVAKFERHCAADKIAKMVGLECSENFIPRSSPVACNSASKFTNATERQRRTVAKGESLMFKFQSFDDRDRMCLMPSFRRSTERG